MSEKLNCIDKVEAEAESSDKGSSSLVSKLDGEMKESVTNKENDSPKKISSLIKRQEEKDDDSDLSIDEIFRLNGIPSDILEDDLAIGHNDNGTLYMSQNKFEKALHSFNKAINAKSKNRDLVAHLYYKRSEAHFGLKDYISAFEDLQEVLKRNPYFPKARLRSAQCAYKCKDSNLGLEICLDLLSNQDEYKDDVVELLRQYALKKKPIEDKQLAVNDFQNIRMALQSRQVKIKEMKDEITEELMQPKILALEKFPVHFDEDNPNTLMWPVAFTYPEHLHTDYHQQVSEEATVLDVLNVIFAKPLPFDVFKMYSIESVNVYYENSTVDRAIQVDVNDPIKVIVEQKEFRVISGSLLFFIVPKGSAAEQAYLNQPVRKIKIYK